MMRVIDKVVEVVLALVLAFTAAVVAVAVFYRYGLNDSLTWTEEITSKMLSCMTFLGGYACFRHGSHLSIDLVPSIVPPAGRKFLKVAGDLIMLAYFLVMAWTSFRVVQLVGHSYLNTTDIPRGWFMAVMPLSFVLMSIAIIYALSGGPAARADGPDETDLGE